MKFESFLLLCLSFFLAFALMGVAGAVFRILWSLMTFFVIIGITVVVYFLLTVWWRMRK